MTPDEARAKLITSLAEVRARFDAGADDWQHSLLRTYREYSRAIGVDQVLLHPLQAMLMDIDDNILRARAPKRGRPTKHIGEAYALTIAAAAVTVLHRRGQCGRISDAVSEVSKLTGIPKATIRNFRDTIHAATANENAVEAYKGFVQEIETWPALDTLGGLKVFLKK